MELVSTDFTLLRGKVEEATLVRTKKNSDNIPFSLKNAQYGAEKAIFPPYAGRVAYK